MPEEENNTQGTNTNESTATNTNSAPMEDFGIGSETVSKTRVNFTGGFTKSILVGVKAAEIGKDAKYFVLDFNFKDIEGIKSFQHRVFIPKGQANSKENEADNYITRKNRFNACIKHIWEGFATFPTEGLGKGATSWNDLFTKIADAFNSGGANGLPIYQE